jgi:hypothetical protein
MKRVRWLSAEWPISIRTLATKMKGHLFAENSFDGFVIDRVRDNFIEAHYIEKMSFQESVTDPFGKEEIFDRVSYRSVEFTLFSDFPNIELRDASRSTRELTNKLLEICNFSLTVIPLTVDLLEWIEAIQRVLNQDILVDSLQVSGFEIEKDIAAKILIKSHVDVRSALKNITLDKKYLLEKVQIKIVTGSELIPIHMTNTGMVKIPENHVNDFLPILRSSLPSPIKKK